MKIIVLVNELIMVHRSVQSANMLHSLVHEALNYIHQSRPQQVEGEKGR